MTDKVVLPPTEESRRHWASSETGKCWCGAEATPEHAAKANPQRDGASDVSRGWRQG